MATERLSKLQKWILVECLKNNRTNYRDVFRYFGKKFSHSFNETYHQDFKIESRYGKNYLTEYNIENIEKQFLYDGKTWKGYKITPKKEFIITQSEKAIISRSLKNLANKGLLLQLSKWGSYNLTEAGFLKANNLTTNFHLISFKEYQANVEAQLRQMQEKREEECRLIRAFINANS